MICFFFVTKKSIWYVFILLLKKKIYVFILNSQYIFFSNDRLQFHSYTNTLSNSKSKNFINKFQSLYNLYIFHYVLVTHKTLYFDRTRTYPPNIQVTNWWLIGEQKKKKNWWLITLSPSALTTSTNCFWPRIVSVSKIKPVFSIRPRVTFARVWYLTGIYGLMSMSWFYHKNPNQLDLLPATFTICFFYLVWNETLDTPITGKSHSNYLRRDLDFHVIVELVNMVSILYRKPQSFVN